MSPRDLFLALCVAAVWGLNFVAIRWGVDEVAPLLMTALRYLFAAVPAVFFVRRPAVAWSVLIGYGCAIGVGQFGLLYMSISLGMPAGLASLVIQIQAFFTMGLAVAFLGERPKPIQWLGAAIAFAGIGVIGAERLEGAALFPLFMTLTAAACWGVGNIITKRAGKVDMLGFVVWSSLVPPIPLMALSLLIEGPGAIPAAAVNLTFVGVGALLFMAYAATIFGYGVWSALLSRYPAGLVAPFSLLVPIAGIASAGLLLGETITGIEIAGSALVFAGLLVNVFGPRLLAGRQVAGR
jgi:O-acetylserine/cysteine efflux transporter